jgi:hypothetical protein
MLVYGVLSFAPTLYIHGCCCGVKEQWLFPPSDCCESGHDHDHGVQAKCCQEKVIQFQLDSNQIPVFFQYVDLCSFQRFSRNIEFFLFPIDSFISVFPWKENPPPILKRFIRFKAIKIFDVVE